MTQEEKDKEAMEKKINYEDPDPNKYMGLNGHFYGEKTVNKAFVTISEAARIAQLPEVQAEVKRIQEEREIKVGDWAFDGESKVFFKVKWVSEKYFGIGPGTHNEISIVEFRAEREICTKITDPAFIALLEAGVKP